MHELSLVKNIVDIANKQAIIHGASKIERIELEIGALAGVELEAFLFAWRAAVPNTVLENSMRIIHQIPAKARCVSCGQEYAIDQLYEPCSHCGEYLNELLQGQELKIKSLTIN